MRFFVSVPYRFSGQMVLEERLAYILGILEHPIVRLVVIALDIFLAVFILFVLALPHIAAILT